MKTCVSKSEIFKHPSFQSIFAYSQIRKLRSQKSEISKRPAEHPAFLIFVNIKTQKLRSFQSNHLWSVLESQCPSIRSFYFYPKAKYENLYLAPHFEVGRLGRIWLQANIEKMNVCKSRIFESKFSYLTTGKYRQDGCLKISDFKHSTFRI